MDSVFLSPHMFAGQARKRTRDIYDDDDGDVLLLDERRFDKVSRSYGPTVRSHLHTLFTLIHLTEASKF